MKNDRRDAIDLAKLHRAEELTAVWISDQADEAIRDLVRARLAAVRSLRQARQQLSGFLLRHGGHCIRPAWRLMHRRWMAGLRFRASRASHRAGSPHRRSRGGDGAARSSGSSYRGGAAGLVAGPGGRAREALRGTALVAAATASPNSATSPARQSPPAHGVSRSVPSEHSSGAARRQGGMTKAGNGAARRMLIERPGVRFPARISREQPPARRVWQADRDTAGRPRSRCAPLSQARPGGKITHSGHDRDRSRTAGFAWAIAKHVQIAGA